MSTLNVKKGDTRSWYSVFTADAASDSDLNDVSTVTFFMRKLGDTTNVINGAIGVVVSKTTTKVNVRYDPVAADVDDEGKFETYWLATFIDSRVGRWPSKGFDMVRIGDNFE